MVKNHKNGKLYEINNEDISQKSILYFKTILSIKCEKSKDKDKKLKSKTFQSLLYTNFIRDYINIFES